MGGKPPKNKPQQPLVRGEDPPIRKASPAHDETPLERTMREAMNGGRKVEKKK